MPNNITQLHIYRSSNDEIEVHMVDYKIWLSLEKMSALFDAPQMEVKSVIEKVIKEDDLGSEAVRIIQETKNSDGTIHYNLDVIIPVGYRINTREASRFRKWANGVLKDYLTDGIVINEVRLENLSDDILDKVAESSIRSVVKEFRKRGLTDRHIRSRLNGIVSRNQVTDALEAKVTDRILYGQFTNQTYVGLFGRKAEALKAENGGYAVRDGMTPQALDILSAAESSISDLINEREYLRYFEALIIVDRVCRKLEPAIKGLQDILKVDLATRRPLLPDDNSIA